MTTIGNGRFVVTEQDSEYSKYPINPDICSSCRYRTRRGHALIIAHLCNYESITNKCKPLGSTFDNCIAYEKEK